MPMPRTRRSCRLCACRACPTCPVNLCQHLSILLPNTQLPACLSSSSKCVPARTHLSHVSCCAQQARYQNDVGECEPGCALRPAEVLVAIDRHVCSSSVPHVACMPLHDRCRESCASGSDSCSERAGSRGIVKGFISQGRWWTYWPI
jgi:hypothetical protein